MYISEYLGSSTGRLLIAAEHRYARALSRSIRALNTEFNAVYNRHASYTVRVLPSQVTHSPYLICIERSWTAVSPMPPLDAGNSLRRCCSLMLDRRSASLIARRSCTHSTPSQPLLIQKRPDDDDDQPVQRHLPRTFSAVIPVPL